jgi:RHS repeat-associated protein
MKLTMLCVFVAILMTGIVPAIAQTNVNEEQGMKLYDSWHGGDLDSISMTNGGLVLHIPLVSFPQRGNLDLSYFITHSTKQWSIKPAKYDAQGHLITPAKWVFRLPGNSTIMGARIASSLDWTIQGSTSFDPISGQSSSSSSISAPDGSLHQLGTLVGGSGCAGIPILRALDATGLLFSNCANLITPNGNTFAWQSGASGTTGTVTDANGNKISVSGSGWTDTLGRVIPGSQGLNDGPFPPQAGIVTTDYSNCPAGANYALVWNVPGVAGVNGGIRTFKFCYSVFSLHTAFNSGPVEFIGSGDLLSAVVLPDLTMWTFNYDNYGDVSRVGFPTGGSLSYTYEVGNDTCGSGTTRSMSVTSRTVDANDGTGGHIWNYGHSGQMTSTPVGNGQFVSSYLGTTVVSDPDGNDTVHTISTPVVSLGVCSIYETQVQNYQGSASGGTLLKTVATQYSGTASNFDTGDGLVAINVVPQQVTVTVPGGKTSKVINTYDAGIANGDLEHVIYGGLLQKDEYDFSGSLVRSTVNHYLWQDNPTYQNGNFLLLLSSSTVKDGGGNQVAQTTYGYDQTAVASSGIVSSSLAAPPAGGNIRGNPTTISHWLNTNNSFISSTSAYLDTGMKASSSDPLGHVTSYIYGSTFQGAYLTQTNLPDTQMPDSGAPVVHHIVSGNYDFNTGALTSFTDENGQSFTYTYDNMLRLSQGNHPDGGITKFLYPDPNTVERQRLITGTTYDDYKVKFDGVGRPTQAQQLTPDCTSYIKVDTSYDPVGHTKTVSNPYCLTTESTYGVIQTDYDALSRSTKTTRQDQSFNTVKFDDTPGDPSGPPLVCTTATDESGRQRQACTDAFGRLVKVLEQNPGAPATFASGSVTIAGAEQSTGGAATSGTATVTISGTEQSAQDCPFGHCHTVWDTGSVTITVNGFTKSASYSNTAGTPALVASALASAFHNDPSSPVNGVASGNTVILTAWATGATTNYSFTTSSATTDSTGTFFSPSFSAGPASGSLSGGHGAGISDTGTVSINVNGTGYSTTFNAGDSVSTIATRLAGIVNSGSFAYASASGGTVNLSSKTLGSTGNYSISASYTWNSGTFAQPSFTAAPVNGATALSGGYAASAIPNQPYVTTYQYDTLGNLVCVHQKANDTTTDPACSGSTPPSVPAVWRQRFFTYDSLGRLLTAYNPENGKMSYQYDNNGNLISKVEPAPNAAWGSTLTVIVNYTYDALNRLLDTTYSDGTTQGTSHRYDYSSYLGQTFSYPIGREVAATAAGATINNFTSYDALGRVKKTVQCNPGVTACQTFTANYDQLGDLTSLIYPANNLTVTYGYDTAARLTSASDSNGVTYATSPTYFASGAMKEFASPNFNNNKFHTELNNRLQPIEIWAGPAQGATALFDKQYQYNAPSTSQMNNGNIYTVTNVKDSSRTQIFTYDILNRLSSAQDNAHWANTYSYDAWGNLWQKTPGAPAGENMNQTPDTGNHLSSYSYDAAGNMQTDGINSWTYVYDAENRIASAGGTTYTYDVDGRRVKKSSGTNYWYGPGGAIMAETDSTGNWTNYIFFGGQRLARNVSGDIKYYITDHLHSTAMFVDKAGTTAAILDDNDFYPWGGVVPGVGQTTSNNHYKMTGKERDTESGLDYYGARYYGSGIGRFMSPDWAAKPATVPYAEFGDPQSLNLYSYTRNSPIIRVDGDGHDANGMLARPGQTGILATGEGTGNGTNEFRDAEINAYIDQLNQKEERQQNQPNNVTGYGTQDQAATAALRNSNGESIKKNKEYAGLIYKDRQGKYHFTGPKEGNDQGSNPHAAKAPRDSEVVGDYHTHGDYSVGGSNGNAVRTHDPHRDDFNSDHFSGVHGGVGGDKPGIEHDAIGKPEYRGYLGTPSGKYLIYNPSTGQESVLQ